MRWIERVKTMIRSWLEIQPASGKGLVIREPVSFETNVLRNRIWYRGDACELDQLFKLLGDDEVSRARFWAAAPEDEKHPQGPQRPAGHYGGYSGRHCESRPERTGL